MATPRTNDLNQTNLALAALAASFAKALGEQFPAFLPQFEQELKKCYDNLADSEVCHTEAMETLRWTNEFLHGK